MTSEVLKTLFLHIAVQISNLRQQITVQFAIVQNRCDAFRVRVTVFWAVTPCNLIYRYRRFVVICRLILQGIRPVTSETADCSAISLRVYQTTRRQISQYRSPNTGRNENHLTPFHTHPNLICIRLRQLQFLLHRSNWLQQQHSPATWSQTDAWLVVVKTQACAPALPLSHVTLVINLWASRTHVPVHYSSLKLHVSCIRH